VRVSEDPTPQRNGSTGPLWYRGKYNLDAQLDHMVASHDLKSYKEIILSGCSAGGMACYIHCDYVASYFKPIPVRLTSTCSLATHCLLQI
jgi:hypothetical protein